MTSADDELHRAKRELDQLLTRMRDSEHARAFFCYADAMVYGALRDLPRNQWESPKVHTPQEFDPRLA